MQTAVSSGGRLHRAALAALVIALLVLPHGLLFAPHYRGLATMPWDFVGGYHTHSWGWYAQGSLLDPPQWLPWSSLGFPAALALQSGSWYLPRALLDVLDLSYTIHVATALQAAHLPISALGCWLLLRALALPWKTALLGAMGWLLSAGLYSNQQHVDIIRAYALLPWLFWAVHPAVLLKSAWRPLVAVLLVFQFLVGAYPGNIASAAYAGALFVAIALRGLPDRAERWRYLRTVAGGTAAGLGMAMLKWGPLLAMPEMLARPERFDVHALLGQCVVTLVLPYQNQLLANDVTMRSLYLPMPLLLGLVFLRGRSRTLALGAGFVATALLLGALEPALRPQGSLLPGLALSRFPLSDWRPVLHIGLLVLGCLGWQALLTQPLGRAAMLARLTLAAAVFGAMLWLGFELKYAPGDLVRALRNFGVCVVLTLALFWPFGADSARSRRRAWAPLVLVLATALDGSSFHSHESLTWRMAWDAEREQQLFGVRIADAERSVPPQALQRRPARLVLGDDIADIVRLAKYPWHNQCWYAGHFCLQGYDNLRLSLPHATLMARLQEPGDGERLLEFLREAQQPLLLPAEQSFSVGVLPPGDGGAAPYLTPLAGASAEPLLYSAERVVYRVHADQPIRVVENEIWWQGWTLRLCRDGECLAPQPTAPTAEYLRSWVVPAGEWRAELSFQQPGLRPFAVVALISALGTLAVTFGALVAGRIPPEAPATSGASAGPGLSAATSLSRLDWAALLAAPLIAGLFHLRTTWFPSGYDATAYLKIATDMARTGLFGNFLGSELRTYGYPLFLCATNELAALLRSPWVATSVAVQTALHLAAALALRRAIAARSPPVARWTFVTVVANPFALLYAAETLTESVALSLTIAAAAAYVAACRATSRTDPAQRRLLTLGSIALGLALVVRPAQLFALPAWLLALAALAWWQRWDGRRLAIMAACVVTGLLVPTLPQLANNVRHHATWTPLMAVPLGGSQQAWGIECLKYATSMVATLPPEVCYANPLAKRGPVDRERPLAWYAQHPGAGAASVALHLFNLLDQDLVFTYAYDLDPWYRRLVGVLTHGVIALAAAGLVLLAARARREPASAVALVALVATIACHLGVHALTAVEMRFGLPLLVLAGPLAAWTLTGSGAMATAWRRRLLALGVIGWIVGALLLSDWVRAQAPQIRQWPIERLAAPP